MSGSTRKFGYLYGSQTIPFMEYWQSYSSRGDSNFQQRIRASQGGKFFGFSRYTEYTPFFMLLKNDADFFIMSHGLPSQSMTTWRVQKALINSGFYPCRMYGRTMRHEVEMIMSTYFLYSSVENNPLEPIFALVVKDQHAWGIDPALFELDEHKHKLEFWIRKDLRSCPRCCIRIAREFALPLIQRQGIRVYEKEVSDFQQKMTPFATPSFSTISEMKRVRKELIVSSVKELANV